MNPTRAVLVLVAQATMQYRGGDWFQSLKEPQSARWERWSNTGGISDADLTKWALEHFLSIDPASARKRMGEEIAGWMTARGFSVTFPDRPFNDRLATLLVALETLQDNYDRLYHLHPGGAWYRWMVRQDEREPVPDNQDVIKLALGLTPACYAQVIKDLGGTPDDFVEPAEAGLLIAAIERAKKWILLRCDQRIMG